MIRSSLLAVAVAVAAVGVAACGGGGDKADRFARDATYTEALAADPGNLHPLRAAQNTTKAVLPYAYDTLINVDAKGGVVSQLAERWETSPRRVTFTLRPDVTCADGSRLQASDVAAVFDWIKDPRHRSTAIGDNLPSPDFEADADDAARTVTISVEEPYGFLLQGAGTVPIVCPKGLADPKSLARSTNGTGPYRLTDYVADDHLTFAVRKDYRWGPAGASTTAPGVPSRVVIRIVKDDATAANLLLSGQLSSAEVSGPDAARLKGRGMQELSEATGPTSLFFNQRPDKPGEDPKVRMALASALDLEQVRHVITAGSGMRPDSLAILPPRPCRVDSVADALAPHDVERAKALLDEAGWIAGADGRRSKDGRPLRVALMFPSDRTPVSAAMELIDRWWSALGVDVELSGRSANAFAQALFQGNDWDVALLAVGVVYPTEYVQFATGPASPESQNFPAIENAEFAKLAQQARATPGRPGCDLWARAEQTLFRDVDVVPLAADVVTTFSKDARVRIGLTGTEPTSIRVLTR